MMMNVLMNVARLRTVQARQAVLASQQEDDRVVSIPAAWMYLYALRLVS
jgi:hypothetical protein